MRRKVLLLIVAALMVALTIITGAQSFADQPTYVCYDSEGKRVPGGKLSPAEANKIEQQGGFCVLTGEEKTKGPEKTKF